MDTLQHKTPTGSSRALFLRLAWRNLWRNKKRTLIACASIFFAVFLSVLVSSTQFGQDEYLINSAVALSTGYIQIHGRDFWEKRSLDESMELDTALVAKARTLPHITQVNYRLETAALIARGTVTKVSPVVGIVPERENAMTGLAKRVVKGTPLLEWHSGVILAEGLARMLGAGVGDSVIIYGQGYEGVTAAGVFPVAAIVHFPIPDVDNAMVYLPLAVAQELYAAPGRVTAIALLLDTDHASDEVADQLRALAGKRLEVMTWRQMMPELVQAVAANDGGTVIMLLILYVVIGFGIFGTVMMMTSERRKEFGITIALGMKRWRLMWVTVLESVMISMMGAITGIVASIPVVAYFVRYPIVLGGDYAKAMLAYGMEPIIPVSMAPFNVFGVQGLIVFALGILSALYPVMVIRNLEPVRAMRG